MKVECSKSEENNNSYAMIMEMVLAKWMIMIVEIELR